MHFFLQLLLVVLASYLLFLIQKSRKNGRKPTQPPGPPGLPLIGNLHQFASAPLHLYFHELSKTYGPLVSLKLGFVPALVVSSAKMAEEVMKTHDHIFSSRPKFTNQQKLSYNGSGIVLVPYGDYWRGIRKICAIHLLSPKKVQSFSLIREEEVYGMIQKITHLSAENRLVNLSEMILNLSNTVICRSAFGRRNSDADVAYRSSIQSLLMEMEELSMGFCFADYFPFMGWADKFTGSSTKLHKVFTWFDGLLEEIIDDHVDTTRPQSEVEDIVDVLLGLQKENSFGIHITRDHIKAILLDLFGAGTETSSATVVMAMTELMKNPEAMRRVQEEARSSTRKNKVKNMIKDEDLEELVYLKAVVKETMRLHPAAPLLVPRLATKNCSIEGYEIQENTMVFVNAWAIGRDPESWEDPDEFKPERFLCDKPVDFRGQDFKLIPFGSGRRICPGMNMGVAVVELVLANLVYFFDWVVPLGMEEDVLDTSVLNGITAQKKIPLCVLAKNMG